MHVSTYLHCKRLQWTLLTKSRNTVDRGLNRFLLWFSNVEFLVWHSLRNDSLNKVHKDWWYENPRKQLWCESTSLGLLRGWSRSQPKAFPDSTEGLTRDAFIITILGHLFILVTSDWQNQLQKKKKKWYKWMYLQNRNRLTDFENKFMVSQVETWVGEG